MRPFIIDKKQMKDLHDFAMEHRIGTDEMLGIMHGTIKPVGDRPGYAINVPIGFEVVFCIEQQPMGWARHLSMSIDVPGKYPHELAMQMTMEELGFETKLGVPNPQATLWVNEQDNCFEIIEMMGE
jgi:hypothetical protein